MEDIGLSDAVIIDGVRTPIGKYGGALSTIILLVINAEDHKITNKRDKERVIKKDKFIICFLFN